MHWSRSPFNIHRVASFQYSFIKQKIVFHTCGKDTHALLCCCCCWCVWRVLYLSLAISVLCSIFGFALKIAYFRRNEHILSLSGGGTYPPNNRFRSVSDLARDNHESGRSATRPRNCGRRTASRCCSRSKWFGWFADDGAVTRSDAGQQFGGQKQAVSVSLCMSFIFVGKGYSIE